MQNENNLLLELYKASQEDESLAKMQEKHKKETEELENQPKLIQNALRVKVGDDYAYLNSRYTWDYQTLELDGITIMVDGGLDYIRKSVTGLEEDWCLYSDSPTELIHERLLWGNSMDSSGKPLKRTIYYPIAQLELAHLEAIIAFFKGSESKISELHEQTIHYWIKQKLK